MSITLIERYRQRGWNTKASGKGKSYKDKAKVKDLAKAGKSVRLYAQWKKKPTTLSKLAARKAYSGTLRKLSLSNHRIYYAYADILGDRTQELVVLAFPTEAMPSKSIIYSLKSGKPKCVMNRRFYGYWNTLIAYKETKALVFYGSSHNVDSYDYYKLGGGKYKFIAGRSRIWPSTYDPAPSWKYYLVNGDTTKWVSKAAYAKKARGLASGKGKKLPFKRMKRIEGAQRAQALAEGEDASITGTVQRREVDLTSALGRECSAVYYVVSLDQAASCEGQSVKEVQVGRVQSGYGSSDAYRPASELEDGMLEGYVGKRVMASGTFTLYGGTFMWSQYQINNAVVEVIG